MEHSYKTILSGEVAGATKATQMDDVPVVKIKFKAVSGNSGNVYIGGSGVTKPNGANDETTGFELDAGEETPWLNVYNLNKFYRICDNAGDDLVYIALR